MAIPRWREGSGCLQDDLAVCELPSLLHSSDREAPDESLEVLATQAIPATVQMNYLGKGAVTPERPRGKTKSPD